MKTEYITETRVLVVSGRLWCGAKCRHEYPLTLSQNPVTLTDARRIAGDFESVEKARIRTTLREITETVLQTRLV